MLREITVTALYECDSDKELVPAKDVESLVFERGIIEFFDSEGFLGVRVDCDDYFNLSENQNYDMKAYIGVDKNVH